MALQVNPNLVGIIKTEYSRELRENTQLVELVPRIAVNIESLLGRHDIVGGVDKLWIEDNVTVDRVNRVKHGQFKSHQKKPSHMPNKFWKKPFCPECHFLARKLKLDINFNHVPANCPRPRSVVNLLLAGEENMIENGEDELMDNGMNLDNQTNSLYMDDETSLNKDGENYCSNFNVNEIQLSDLYMKVLMLEQKFSTVRKEYSPQLRTKIGEVFADSIIDEGSELNCICSSVAAKCNIRYKPVQINAMSAGSNIMKLLGVVPDDITLNVYDSNIPVKIVLRNAVVVKNLGPHVLIGEPGKMDNDIITIPRKKLIQLKNVHGKTIQLPYRSRQGSPLQQYQAFVVKQNTTLYPGDELDAVQFCECHDEERLFNVQSSHQ